jgi:uroporphyrinogen-III decarboxylase
MVREPLGPGELFFRSLAPGDTFGGAVLPTSVDMPASSFNRAAYSVPEKVRRSDLDGIAEIPCDALPAPVDVVVSPKETNTWVFFAEDDPTPTNDAHAEIRLKRADKPYDAGKRFKPAMKTRIREALAKALRVRLEPTG